MSINNNSYNGICSFNWKEMSFSWYSHRHRKHTMEAYVVQGFNEMDLNLFGASQIAHTRILLVTDYPGYRTDSNYLGTILP